jgi:hypothetical protein
MARSVSWFPRLPALARTVGDSVRSHYSSSDLQQLFEVQPRSAQMLLGLLPTVTIGKSILVEREALSTFLARLIAADDPAKELTEIRRKGKPAIVRRKLRELIQTDAVAGQGLPENLRLSRGSLAITFDTVEDLANALWQLAYVLDADLDGFAEKYEPIKKTDPHTAMENQLAKEDMDYIRTFLSQTNVDGATS